MAQHDFGLDRFRAAVGSADTRDPGVSDWSVWMHVHHCCLGMTRIVRGLAESRPPKPRSRFSLPRLVVLTTGMIPRGRAKSPEAVVPDESVTARELNAMLDESDEMLDQAVRLGPEAWFEHFAFGPMGRDDALRFLRIHNRHHLKIIDDITGAGRGGRG